MSFSNVSRPIDWKELKRKKREWKAAKEAKRLKRAQLEEERKIKENEVESAIELSHGIKYTISIAIPASIIDNAQSEELKTYLIGQVARALVIFNCDEVVVYDEYACKKKNRALEEHSHKKSKCLEKMARVLQYLECPQYLRKWLFPLHNDLKYAGLLSPLAAVHHYKESDITNYREGVVSKQSGKNASYVNVGLRKDVLIDQLLTPGLRVTVKFNGKDILEGKKKIRGKCVPPREPREKYGLYWGYNVRLAESLSEVFEVCPWGEYDCKIGTSEKGKNIDEVNEFPDFKHAIIVFGGLQGIEAAFDAEERENIKETEDLFDYYLNTCPSQGSHTIRTEEALLISLSILRSKLWANKLNLK